MLISGGDAQPLTPAGSHAATPIWSPDGNSIAFAADRFGAMNIFAVPAGGGEAKRLTWYSVDEKPSSFTPDGKAVLFSARRLGDATETFAIPNRFEQGSQLYQVPISGGRDTIVLPNAAFDARWDADGKRLLYTAPSIEQSFRKGQTSSAARQVWLYEAGSGRHERLTDDTHESRDAVWSPDGTVYYLGEASGSLNIWRLSLTERKPEQVTHLTGDPVRSLSMSRSGILAFSRGGELYLLRPGAKDPERIAVNVAQSALSGESPSQTSSFNDIVPSPTGKEIALVTRGDIFVASLNGRYVKRITRTPGEERNPSFSPDGRKLVYAAERDGRWSLYEAGIVDPEEKSFFEATRIEERLLQAGKEDAMTPVFAPDGKHVAYIANRDSVRVLDVATKADIEILPKGMNYFYGDWSWWLSWSPDSKWLAFPIQPSQQIDNVAVAPADGHAPAMRVAPSGEDQSPAEWSQDGSFLLWASDAEGLRYINGRTWSADIEGVYVSRKARDAFEQKLRVPVIGDAPSGSEEEERRPGTPDEKEAMAPPKDGARPRASKPREAFTFEPAGVEDRTIRLTQQPASLVYFGLLADGVSVLSVERYPTPQGDGFTVTGVVRDLRRERRRTLFSGLSYVRSSPVRMSRDQKKLYFLSPDGVTEVDTGKGSSRVIKITADTTRDAAETRQAAFNQFWMLTKKKFYDPNFNGVDWEAVQLKYSKLLPSIVDTRDLAELLSEMAGELNASHTGGRLRSSVPPAEQTASLGLYYDERYSGPGMKVAEILANGPFDSADSALAPGDVILEIDGEPVPNEGGIRRALRGRAKQVLAITAEHPGGQRFTEKHVPVSLGKEQELAAARWLKRKRDYVIAKSCGHLGYVYVADMDEKSYRWVFSEIFGRFQQADALIVDVRYNGGGNLHNQLLTLLSGKNYMTYVPPRGGPTQQEPRDRWSKPSAVIMNAVSYSDASVFPQAYRDLKLGPLVGDSVAGTGTFVWWAESNIIPGLVYGLPQLPIRKLNGKFIENEDITPDIPVLSNPTAWSKGQDPQLDAAMRAMLPAGSTSCRSP
ncbi:S41 family peptidase [Bosea sp. 685]|uniref:S41 family peptidase n=1 Tax=Bosea sp. 685 TaxID=3080057 RepID=UPI002892F35A|nr:S41 family peptidase [Bosea sp. 685]WNJ88553.1 S41 family peptidase [Bosea sp. 685]